LKRIHRAWYTTYRASLPEENDCRFAQSKGFRPGAPSFGLADDFLQHRFERPPSLPNRVYGALRASRVQLALLGGGEVTGRAEIEA
jgi:hypothetical protein